MEPRRPRCNRSYVRNFPRARAQGATSRTVTLAHGWAACEGWDSIEVLAAMISSADMFGMVDPVCQTPVDAGSIHHFVHGGALFSFCCEECRSRFAVDPSRWAVSALLGGVRAGSTVAERHVPPPPAPVAAALEPDHDEQETVVYRRPFAATTAASTGPMGDPDEPAWSSTSGVDLELDIPQATARTLLTEPTGQFLRPTWVPHARRAEPETHTHPAAAPMLPVNEQALSGKHALFSPIKAWRERQSATLCCRELLKVYYAVAEEHPGLDRTALYRRVVMARTGHDQSTADSILRKAEESFASWPAKRDLNFRDVVHYLAVSEFLASHPRSRWVHADMRRIVQSLIQHVL